MTHTPTHWRQRSWFGRLACRWGFHRWAGYSVPLRPLSEMPEPTPFARHEPPDGTRRECYCGHRERFHAALGWHNEDAPVSAGGPDPMTPATTATEVNDGR